MAYYSFLISKYRINIKAGFEDEHIHVYLTDDSNHYRGYICFRENFRGNTLFVTEGIISVHMPLKKYEYVIDVLRNEYPVWLFVNEQNDLVLLCTGSEPVGEGEGL